MKKILISLTILAAMLVSSCADFLDVNKDPNNPSEAAAHLRLPPILFNLHNRYGGSGTRTAMLTQQYGSPASSTTNYGMLQNWQWSNNVDINTWQGWYVYIYVNIPKMYDEAKAVNANHYMGVARVLEAFGWAWVCDLYGYVVFNDALSKETLTPNYDDAKDVYPKLYDMLDEGIALLAAPQTTTLSPPLSVGDYMYNGDTGKWIKFAYAIKARLLNHMSKKSTYDPQKVLDFVDLSFISNADNAEITSFEDGSNSAKWNVLYENSYDSKIAMGSSSIRYGKLFVDYLSNTYDGVDPLAYGEEDPRKPLMVAKQVKSGATHLYTNVIDLDLVGGANPIPKSNDSTYVSSMNTFWCKKDSPFAFMSFYELKFIEAEAAFRMGNTGRAHAAYLDGIKAHMERMGIPAGDITTYLGKPAIAQLPTDLTLSHIMIQKYITLFQNPEAWTDMRRCDYCLSGGQYDVVNGVYKGFKKPKYVHSNFSNADDGNYVRRFQTAYTERYYNNENVRLIGGYDNSYTAKPIFWDEP